MKTRDERLADFRRRQQPYMDALRRGEWVDLKVTFGFMRERLLDIDDMTFEKRLERLFMLAEVHRGVDDEQAIALYRRLLELEPRLDGVRRRMQWLEKNMARRSARAQGRTT